MVLNRDQKKWKNTIKKQFGKEWFLNKNRIAFKLRLKKVKEFIPRNKHILLLDIGTADGEMMYELNNNASFDIYSVGIEISPEIIKFSRLFLKKSKNKQNLNFINADSDFLPLRNEIFNFLIGTSLIEHVPNPYMTLKEIKRVASKRSQILLTTPNPLYQPLFKLLAKLKLKFKESKLNNSQKISNLKELMKKLKLKIFYASGFSAISSIIDKILSKISFRGYHVLTNQIIVGEKK